MNKFKSLAFGNIYNEGSTFMDYGGPKCYAEMSLTFRSYVILFSTLCNVLFMWKLYPTIKRSSEVTKGIGKQPNIIEKMFGYLSWTTFVVQITYKFYTHRGIYIFNPCHIVVLVQGFLLLFPKTVNTAYAFICYTRWIFGVYAALLFPDLEGLDLKFESEMFWIEHWMGLIGPIVLVASGRYGFIDWGTLFHHQLFGFASIIIYSRIILSSLSIMTFANLNFNLCRSNADPWLPLVGNQWYHLFSEYYLEIVSTPTYLVSIAGGKTIQLFLKPFFKSKEKIQ